jgi:hypothetical protein
MDPGNNARGSLQESENHQNALFCCEDGSVSLLE